MNTAPVVFEPIPFGITGPNFLHGIRVAFFEDALAYGLDAPDSIDDELPGATLDDIDSLSPAARAELMRRLGAENAEALNTDLDGRAPWRVETSIKFDDEENN